MRYRVKAVLAGVVLVLSAAAIAVLWYFGPDLVYWRSKQLPETAEAVQLGAVGDIFGAMNALFAGLAFMAVALSLILMMRQISATQRQIVASAAPLLIPEIKDRDGLSVSATTCSLHFFLSPKNLSIDAALSCTVLAEWLAGDELVATMEGTLTWPIMQDSGTSLKPDGCDVLLTTEPRKLSSHTTSLQYTRERLKNQEHKKLVRLRLTLEYENTHGHALQTVAEFGLIFSDRGKGEKIVSCLEELPASLPEPLKSRIEAVPLEGSFQYSRPSL